MDIKAMYQVKAEELAQEEFGKELYDLSYFLQVGLYEKAEELVNEQLIDAADNLREELKLRKGGS